MTTVSAAWLEDPTGRHQWRYWNGERWTEEVADDGTPATDALTEDLAAPEARTRRLDGAKAKARELAARVREAAPRPGVPSRSTPASSSLDAEVMPSEPWVTPTGVHMPAVPIPGGEDVLWEGERHSVAAAATGGRLVSARYRVTASTLYFDAGLLSTRSEQVPVWALRNVNVRQTMTQKARSVGDVVVQLEHSDYTGRGVVVLESVDEPHAVRDLLNRLAEPARREYQARSQTSYLQHSVTNPGGGVVSPPGGPPVIDAASTPAPAPIDVADQLRKLAALRDEGILTEDEFAVQKARLLNS